MRAAVAYDVDDIRVEERPDPVPGPGEAVVRVRACGVCSGDALAWYVRRKLPSVLGHEPVGMIEAVGAGVVWPREGDRVFVHHHAPCGRCHLCRRGHTTQCPAWKSSSLDPGGFAELVRVPALNLAEDTLGIPSHVSDAAATMLEPLACCVRAFTKLPLHPGDSVLVIGMGTMGILNVALAKAMGVERIFASDFVPWRRVQATRFGATHVFDPGAGDVAEMVRDATDGLGADHVIVGPGGSTPLAHGIDCAAPGATVVAFTDSQAGDVLRLEPSLLYKPEITLAASYSCGPADTRAARRLMADGALPLDDMITHHWDLAGVQAAIALTASAGESLKSVCWPGGVPADVR